MLPACLYLPASPSFQLLIANGYIGSAYTKFIPLPFLTHPSTKLKPIYSPTMYIWASLMYGI